MRADLRGRLLPARPRRRDEVDGDRARGVDDLQPGARVPSEVERAVRGLLLGEDRRTRIFRMGHRVAPAGGTQSSDVRAQQRVALGVDEHERAERRRGAHTLEQLGVGDVRVGRLGHRHERLEAHRALRPLPLHVLERGRRQRSPQPEVDDDLGRRHLALARVEVDGRHRRVAQRVLDDRGEAAGGGRHCPRGEVLALGVARILEVRVRVDRPGHHDRARCVDDLIRAREHVLVGGQGGDPLPFDHDVGGEHTVVSGHRRVRDDDTPPLQAPSPLTVVISAPPPRSPDPSA